MVDTCSKRWFHVKPAKRSLLVGVHEKAFSKHGTVLFERAERNPKKSRRRGKAEGGLRGQRGHV